MPPERFSTVERTLEPWRDDVQSVAVKRERTLLFGSNPSNIPCPVNLGSPLIALDAILSGISNQRLVSGRTFFIGLRGFASFRLQVSHQASIGTKNQIPVWIGAQRKSAITTVLKLKLVGHDPPRTDELCTDRPLIIVAAQKMSGLLARSSGTERPVPG
jgi:hypothetical protein